MGYLDGVYDGDRFHKAVCVVVVLAMISLAGNEKKRTMENGRLSEEDGAAAKTFKVSGTVSANGTRHVAPLVVVMTLPMVGYILRYPPWHSKIICPFDKDF